MKPYIDALIHYALRCSLIAPEDDTYIYNALLAVMIERK